MGFKLHQGKSEPSIYIVQPQLWMISGHCVIIQKFLIRHGLIQVRRVSFQGLETWNLGHIEIGLIVLMYLLRQTQLIFVQTNVTEMMLVYFYHQSGLLLLTAN